MRREVTAKRQRAMAGRIAAMPRFGLALAKKVVEFHGGGTRPCRCRTKKSHLVGPVEPRLRICVAMLLD